MGDIPRDLLELNSASAQRLTALLNEVDRQMEEMKQKKAKQAKEEGGGYGEQKRPAIAPPPGYESNSGVVSVCIGAGCGGMMEEFVFGEEVSHWVCS